MKHIAIFVANVAAICAIAAVAPTVAPFASVTLAAQSCSNVPPSWSANSGYLPVPADFDGDGGADLAFYVQSTGNWHVLLSNANFTTAMNENVGGVGYSAVPADVDGDGEGRCRRLQRHDRLMVRPAVRQRLHDDDEHRVGRTGYAPVKGEFDGDGRVDLGLFQVSSGTWYVLLSGANYTTTLIRASEAAGEVPVPLCP